MDIKTSQPWAILAVLTTAAGCSRTATAVLVSRVPLKLTASSPAGDAPFVVPGNGVGRGSVVITAGLSLRLLEARTGRNEDIWYSPETLKKAQVCDDAYVLELRDAQKRGPGDDLIPGLKKMKLN